MCPGVLVLAVELFYSPRDARALGVSYGGCGLKGA